MRDRDAFACQQPTPLPADPARELRCKWSGRRERERGSHDHDAVKHTDVHDPRARQSESAREVASLSQAASQATRETPQALSRADGEVTRPGPAFAREPPDRVAS